MGEVQFINILIYSIVMSIYSTTIIINCTFMDNSGSSGGFKQRFYIKLGALYIIGNKNC